VVIETEQLNMNFKEACDAILNGYRDTLRAGGCPIVLGEQEVTLKRLGLRPRGAGSSLDAIERLGGPHRRLNRLHEEESRTITAGIFEGGRATADASAALRSTDVRASGHRRSLPSWSCRHCQYSFCCFLLKREKSRYWRRLRHELAIATILIATPVVIVPMSTVVHPMFFLLSLGAVIAILRRPHDRECCCTECGQHRRYP
jgi:hypothetical protein